MLAILLAASPAASDVHLLGPSLTAVQENDLVVRTDRHYTQGLGLVFLAAESAAAADTLAARAARALPAGHLDLEAARWGLRVGQLIFTPEDVGARRLQVNDRPYAGYLFVGLALQRRGRVRRGYAVLDHLELDLGVIGPEALGEEAQNTVHRLRNFPLARGWDNQLDTEPGVALRFERRGRVAFGNPRGFAAELLPHGGASLGNVGTFASLGTLARAGWRLPPDFGVATNDSLVPASGGRPQGEPSPPFGGYVFMEVEGRAVAYTTFLDGNLFHDSHDVEKDILVGDLRFGAALVFARFDLAYAQVIRSREFAKQDSADSFGSISLRLKW